MEYHIQKDTKGYCQAVKECKMEPKSYQKSVIRDLENFLELLTEKSISDAYRTLWEDKGVIVGFEGMPAYQNDIANVPHVCIKVPTGGGKTFIAANAIKPIFDSMKNARVKAVVWLVPTDSILTQTLKNLSDVNHPYRQKVDVDFGGKTEIYSKAQLLNGQNFNPITVTEQLSIFVLSYDSFRTSQKDGRKAYQQNGYLAPFEKMVKKSSNLLDNTDETALIQVIRSLNPVVIVDESHHAASHLSLQMLEAFNPCFILDLTATPKQSSNIISFVDAAQLKRENMVKLPVIVYNRKSQDDVYSDAITIRRKLELRAKADMDKTGRYIRPITLFQAQPRNNEDSTTYDKIKKTLIELGIPEHHIAIKTGDRDELKNIDLLSPDCHIRYIITVNALKEGWDCPFAYVLATIANRSSVVDVEQILGRVLRQPYAKMNQSKFLNMSYVLTSSADFNETLEKVVAALNSTGFSKNDCRANDYIEDIPAFEDHIEFVQPEFSADSIDTDSIPEINITSVREKLDNSFFSLQNIAASNPDQIFDDDYFFESADEQNLDYEKNLNQADKSETNFVPQEVRDKMNVFSINKEFIDDVVDIKLPQFVIATDISFFTDEYKLLRKEDMSEDFTLNDKDARVDFSTIATEMARIDIEENKDSSAKAWKITGTDSTYLKEWFNSLPSESRLNVSKQMIRKELSDINGVNDSELDEYINRIVNMMTEDQISDFEQSQLPYIKKIKEKVSCLIDAHRKEKFDLWLEQDKISCKPYFIFKKTISPTTSTSTFPKSLYEAEEGGLNNHEKNVVFAISSLPNVKWWHRNISKVEFQINGPIHAYPDFIIKLNNGKILMVEPKGDDRDNPESKEKAWIGTKWAELAGKDYKYFMVFEKKQPDYPGAYSFDKFMEILKGL